MKNQDKETETNKKKEEQKISHQGEAGSLLHGRGYQSINDLF